MICLLQRDDTLDALLLISLRLRVIFAALPGATARVPHPCQGTVRKVAYGVTMEHCTIQLLAIRDSQYFSRDTPVVYFIDIAADCHTMLMPLLRPMPPMPLLFFRYIISLSLRVTRHHILLPASVAMLLLR